MLTLNKTKATLQSCQCHYEKPKQIKHTRVNAGGQSLSAPVITGTAPLARFGGMSKSGHSRQGYTSFSVHLQTTQKLGCLGCTALAHTPFPQIWGDLDQRTGCTAMQHTSFRVAKMQLGTFPQLWSFPPLWYQAFGSMPRDCSSFRKTRFIHVAREESPSFFISASSCARNSCWRRIWYWSVLVLVLDIVITKSILSAGGCNYNVTEMVLQLLNMTKPCSARTLTGPLTKPLIGVTVMAEQQHTQTRPEFTWLFLATPDHTPECSPVVLRFDADTEDKARAAFPGWDLVFAAKIRAHAPCRVAFFDYTTRRGWEFDSAAIQEVRHA